MRARPPNTYLSEHMKTACAAVLKEGRAALIHPTKFRTPGGSIIQTRTAIAICERYLGKIVVESRHRKYQFLELTDIGRMVALQVIAERAPSACDDFEDSPNMYAAEEEGEKV